MDALILGPLIGAGSGVVLALIAWLKSRSEKRLEAELRTVTDVEAEAVAAEFRAREAAAATAVRQAELATTAELKWNEALLEEAQKLRHEAYEDVRRLRDRVDAVQTTLEHTLERERQHRTDAAITAAKDASEIARLTALAAQLTAENAKLQQALVEERERSRALADEMRHLRNDIAGH